MAGKLTEQHRTNRIFPDSVDPKAREVISNSKAALGCVKLSTKTVDRIYEQPDRFRTGLIATEQRRYRDAYCVLDYFKAENKDECLALLSEKWGLTAERIQKNILKRLSTMDFPIELVASVKAVQQVKSAQILLDGQDRRSDLKKELSKNRRDKSDFHDVEQIEEVGEKGTITKTKRVARPEAIDRIHAKIQDSHESEAKAHGQYMPKPAIQIDIAGKVDFVAQASEEMKEMLGNMRAINAKPTESEEIENEKESISG